MCHMGDLLSEAKHFGSKGLLACVCACVRTCVSVCPFVHVPTTDPGAMSVLCLPILQGDSDLVAVVELTRGRDQRPFTPEEEEVGGAVI